MSELVEKARAEVSAAITAEKRLRAEYDSVLVDWQRQNVPYLDVVTTSEEYCEAVRRRVAAHGQLDQALRIQHWNEEQTELEDINDARELLRIGRLSKLPAPRKLRVVR